MSSEDGAAPTRAEDRPRAVTVNRERANARYPSRLERIGAPLWLLTGCLVLVFFGHRGQASVLILCLGVWASMWVPYVLLCRQGSEQHGLGAGTILAWALLFRLVLLLAGLPADSPSSAWAALRDDLSGQTAGYEPFLLWDNDVWRYLWDGHVATAGRSPYRITPEQVIEAADVGQPWAEELVEQGPWLDVLDAMSYRDHPSVYPPLAIGLFRSAHVIAPGSVFVWKLQLVAIEWIGCVLFVLLLRATNRPDHASVWLAWNPLLLKEVAGSGHLEGALIPLLVATLLLAARRREAWAALALATATLIKLWPLLLAPALLVRARPRAWFTYLGAVALGLLPWLDVLPALLESLRSFAGTWVFNPGAWLIFESVAEGVGAGQRADASARVAHLGLTALVVCILLWIAARATGSPGVDRTVQDVGRDWLWILVVYLLLAPTVMPWYLTVALPLAALSGFWPWHVVSVASVLSYLIYAFNEELAGVLLVEHTAIAIALLLWTRRRLALGNVGT